MIVEVRAADVVEMGPFRGLYTEVHVFWLAGMSCDGCSIAVTGATNPSVEDLLTGRIPGLPRIILHHPVLDVEAGERFVRWYELAARGELARELSIPLVFGVANKIRTDREAELVRKFCEARHLPLLTVLPYDEAVGQAEVEGRPVFESRRDLALVRAVDDLASRLEELSQTVVGRR